MKTKGITSSGRFCEFQDTLRMPAGVVLLLNDVVVSSGSPHLEFLILAIHPLKESIIKLVVQTLHHASFSRIRRQFPPPLHGAQTSLITTQAQVTLFTTSPTFLPKFSRRTSKPSVQFSLLSHVWLFATPWTIACQASLSITNSQSRPKPMPIESVMPSSHLILRRSLLLLPPIPPSIRVFSNESALRIRWPKYWSFSFNISPSNEHPGLISFRMDWLDLL